MQAIRFSRFDGPDALEVIDVPKPRPKAGEVLVRVRAAGVNFFETLMLRDRYAVTPDLPRTPGVEVAGEIEAVGEDVRFPEIGERVAVPVFAVGRDSGGYAEYLAIDAASVVTLPENLSFENAVALMVQGLTALHLVHQSWPKGKTVLVNAAGGGVGSLLVQLAKQAGAKRVIAAASSREKRRLAQSLGADAGIDYTHADWTDRVQEANDGVGVDVIYETVGGAHTRACLAALAPLGEMMFAALGRFDLAPVDLEGMLFKSQALKGFALLPRLASSDHKTDLAHLYQQAANGTLKVVEGASYPLEQAAEAHRALESRQTVGKIVLSP